MFQKFSPALLALAVAGLLSSCSDDEKTTPNTTVNVSALLNGNEQTPAPVTTPASGTMTGTYNTETRQLSYTVAYQGFDPNTDAANGKPTQGHIHQAPAGAEGPVVVAFTSVATSPFSGTATLTQADGDKLMAGAMYVNLHTTRYPNGEIRGNILASDPNDVKLTATIDGYSQVPSNTSTATGTMTGVYNKSSRKLTYSITYQGFTPNTDAANGQPNAGHFHQAPAGSNGNIIVYFPNFTKSTTGVGTAAGTATLTQADGDKLLAGDMYVNLHTARYPGGEIRGQVRQQ